MTESRSNSVDESSGSIPPAATSGFGVAGVVAYLETYRGRYTDQALTTALSIAGYANETIEEAMAQARAFDASKSARKRAKWVVLAAYLGTYALLWAESVDDPKYGSVSGDLYVKLILTFLMGVAAPLVSLMWILRRKAGAGVTVGGLLAVPFVLLVIVAGLCVSTGLLTGSTGN